MMRELLCLLKKRNEEGLDTMLVTIVEEHGSAPRSAGAYMAADETGRIQGTIGGGSLEFQAIREAGERLREGKNFRREYDLGAGSEDSPGMVCGGRVTVLFYCLLAGDSAAAEFLQRAADIAQREVPYELWLPLSEGQAQIREAPESAQEGRIRERMGRPYYVERFGYDGSVYIFGGGHLAQELVPVLSHLEFRCVVLEDREEYARPSLFAGAAEVRLVDFASLEEELSVTQRDYLVVVTRGHACDVQAERFGLRTAAGYIGVVGSRRKTAYVRELLQKEGFSEQELDRVHAPIGIDIGSETPAEIAISIAAELIRERAMRYGKKGAGHAALHS